MFNKEINNDSVFFLGDVAHPHEKSPEWIDFFYKRNIVLNLEGAIIDENNKNLLGKDLLFNHDSIFPSITKNNFVVACIANNHIDDLENGISATKKILEKNNIQSFGAGVNLSDASQPAIIKTENYEIILVAFGWQTIHCTPATKNKAGVNPLEGKKVLQQVEKLRANYPDSILICCFHWNYELERYPQPSHRKLAFDLIDIGVDCIIGHHPHIVNGVEIYKGKPIVYSLGNWWLPQGVFFDGKLKYSEESKTQLAFQFSADGNHICHWFKMNDNALEFLESSHLTDCKRINELTPFDGYSHDEYITWFKDNREKKLILPIYKNPYSSINLFYDIFVKIRHVGVLMIVKLIKIFK